MRTPMQDGGMNVRCEHQCKQQWTETATDEDVCCFCFVVSVFVAFGVRTLQLCFYIVASVYVAVGVRTLKLCFCFVASVFVAVGVRTLQLCSHTVNSKSHIVLAHWWAPQ